MNLYELVKTLKDNDLIEMPPYSGNAQVPSFLEECNVVAVKMPGFIPVLVHHAEWEESSQSLRIILED